jgi:lambda repressor-like predicted transcriptional regulator
MTIKLPWTQLAEFCGQQYDPTNEITNISDIGIVSRLTGINRHTLYNYIRHGLSVWQADDIAVALGVHPSAIWPRWYEITGNLDQEAK